GAWFALWVEFCGADYRDPPDARRIHGNPGTFLCPLPAPRPLGAGSRRDATRCYRRAEWGPDARGFDAWHSGLPGPGPGNERDFCRRLASIRSEYCRLRLRRNLAA